ncbi:hypothetical protein BJP40_22840 [Streptomyces sp. CC53]|uniref:hypothetical protein n=1 Tax=unclassified Streptomyces TaxID=2593676 RepID=UPI0008DD44F1|nr:MULTISPECIES: hypothetical protein [unclassified Streptomyces]OII63834.1 hypothetical protein BJP40_22840 [Streptomyces sp. CC53]
MAATVLSPLLRRLAADRATGALVRDHGTLYLVDGAVVHAESPYAPGLDALLGTAAPRPPVGAGEWEICRLGALYDAAFFALAPGRGPARFRYGDAAPGAAHPAPGHPGAAPGRPVSAADVERETLRRRALLDRVWPHPVVDTAPVVPARMPRGRTAGVRGRALLARADGRHTPTQLAHTLGRPAFHTLLEVRRLAAAGLVETPQATAPRTPPAPTPPVPSPRAPHGGHRTPRTPIAPPVAAPDVDLLRRVRDLLEARL